MQQFIARHADQITGVLSGFDRVILRGSLMPLCHEDGVRRFLSRQGVLLKDFEPFAKATTALVRDGAFEATVGHGRPTIYLESSQTSKEGEARKLLAEHPIQSGLICLLRTLEPCWTWQVWRSRERKHPQQVRRKHTKGLSFYTYFDDPQFGFGHVRVQSYMPYHVQVYVNGREWLGRQLDHIGMRYIRADNCFPHLADVQRAQRVFDGMLDLPWRGSGSDPEHVDVRRPQDR